MHVPGFVRLVDRARFLLLLTIIAPAATGIAQECVPGEMSAPPPKPEPKKCSLIDVMCKYRNAQAESEWESSTRTFSSPLLFSTDGDSAMQVSNFQVLGCAGAVVIPTIEQKDVVKLVLEVLAPSGASVSRQEVAVTNGMMPAAAFELPESGRYNVRLHTTGTQKPIERCPAQGGVRVPSFTTSLGKVSMPCGKKEKVLGFPREVKINWRGSAGLAPLLIGDEWSATLEPNAPMTRRVRVDAGAGASIRLASSTTVPVGVAVRALRGGVISEQNLATGSGGVLVAAKEEEQEVILRLQATGARAPLSVRVSVDSGGPSPKVAVEPPKAAALQIGTDAEGLISAASGSAPDKWTFTARAGERYILSIVPSGRAGLELEASVFSEKTEESLGKSGPVQARYELRFRTPAAGSYAVDVRALKIATPDASGRARYTLQLRRDPQR